MNVPFVDLGAHHAPLRSAIDAAIAEVIDDSAFILGHQVDRFEREIAAYFATTHALGVSSGTDALHLALRALGIGPGDEVVVPSWSFIATASAVAMCGATPVFADIDPATCLLDPASASAQVSPRTRAIVPVHLYGQSVDLEPFLALAATHRIRIVEDACQAHGARQRGRAVGTIGDIGCFSFYPAKNLGAMGDGGLVVTDDADLARELSRLRHHGQIHKNQHDRIGYTNRLDGIQAAVLRVKLPYLDDWNAARKLAAERLSAGLGDLPLRLPGPHDGADHVYHLYVIRTERRDALQAHLTAAGIQTALHYPTPIHRTAAFLTGGLDLPHTDQAGQEVLSLPMYPELQEQQIEAIVTAVRSFFRA